MSSYRNADRYFCIPYVFSFWRCKLDGGWALSLGPFSIARFKKGERFWVRLGPFIHKDPSTPLQFMRIQVIRASENYR